MPRFVDWTLTTIRQILLDLFLAAFMIAVLVGLRVFMAFVSFKAWRMSRKLPPIAPPDLRPFRTIPAGEALLAQERERCNALLAARIVYLDWNVLQDIQDGHLSSLRDFLVRRQDEGVVVPFSLEHAREAAGRPGWRRRMQRAQTRLRWLGNFTRHAFLYHAADTRDHARLESSTPEETLQNFENSPWWSTWAMNTFEDLFSRTMIQRTRAGLGVDPKILSQITPEDVPLALDLHLRAAKERGGSAAPSSLAEFLDWTRRNDKNSVNSDEVTRTTVTCRMFEFFGYRPEKKSKVKSAFLDYSHAGVGILADVFITRDKNLLWRARATYSFLGRATVTVRADVADEFVKNCRLAPEVPPG